MPQNSEKVSLIINTKNEEQNIASCIKSAKSLVDEVVVVDMGSTDQTREIAKRLGARVFKIKNYGYVEPAREFAISKAKHNWILLLDADERMNTNLSQTLSKIAKSNKYDVVKIPYKNIIFGKWINHAWWWPDYHERFYKRGHVVWSSVIHSAPKITGRIHKLPATEENAIYHENYKTIDQFIEKLNRYTDFGKDIDKKVQNAESLLQYFKGEFLFRYVHQEGYKDGLHGYFLSKLMEFYRFVELAKYWERTGFKNFVKPKELQAVVMRDLETSEMVNLRNQINSLNNELKTIKSAKFFRVWQFYCNIRDKIFQKIK